MATKNFYRIDSYDKLFAKCDGLTSPVSNPSFETGNPPTEWTTFEIGRASCRERV
jgi:hypothetical protein